jgi:hypothetical protein
LGLSGSGQQACQALLAQESKCPVVPLSEARYCDQHLSPIESAALATRARRLGAVPIALGQPWQSSFTESLNAVLGRGPRPMSRYGSCDLEKSEPPRALRLFSADGWPTCLGFMTKEGWVGTAAHCLQSNPNEPVEGGELALQCDRSGNAPPVTFKCTPAVPNFNWLRLCSPSGGAEPPRDCARDIAVCRPRDPQVPASCRTAVAWQDVATQYVPKPELAASPSVALSNSSFGFKRDEVSTWTQWPMAEDVMYVRARMKIYPPSSRNNDCGGSEEPVQFGEGDSGGPLIAGQTVIGIVPMSNADPGPARFVPTFAASALWK